MKRTAKRMLAFVLSFVICISLFAGVTIRKPKSGSNIRHSLIIIAYADAEETETPAEGENGAPSSGGGIVSDTAGVVIDIPVVGDTASNIETSVITETASIEKTAATNTEEPDAVTEGNSKDTGTADVVAETINEDTGKPETVENNALVVDFPKGLSSSAEESNGEIKTEQPARQDDNDFKPQEKARLLSSAGEKTTAATLEEVFEPVIMLKMSADAMSSEPVAGQSLEDILPPELIDLILSKTNLEISSEDYIIADVYADDDVSGLNEARVVFRNAETGKELVADTSRTYYVLDENGYITLDENYEPITAEYPNGAAEGKITADQYLPSGDYNIYSIMVWDKAGNRQDYSVEHYDSSSYNIINNLPEFVRSLYITVINNGYIKPKPTPQPAGDTAIDYVSATISQGEISTDSVSNLPGYDVDISQSETYEDLKNALLITEEQLEVARGKDVTITLEFNQAEVSAADLRMVEDTIGGGIIATWLDISVFKQIEGSEKTKVDKPNGKVKLQITAPDEIISLAAAGVPFEVIRIADGEIIRIPAFYNVETNTIDFETDTFGVFALVYSV